LLVLCQCILFASNIFAAAAADDDCGYNMMMMMLMFSSGTTTVAEVEGRAGQGFTLHR